MIDITYTPLKNVNKLRLLYGEGYIKALAGKVFWIGEDEKRYIMEVKIDIHSPPTKNDFSEGQQVKNEGEFSGDSSPETSKGDTQIHKWKECENCGYKAEKEPEVDFLVCPMCNTDLEEFEE